MLLLLIKTWSLSHIFINGLIVLSKVHYVFDEIFPYITTAYVTAYTSFNKLNLR